MNSKAWTERQRRLLMIVVGCAAVVAGDIVIANVVGEMSDTWWVLAVPVGLLLVPIVGLVALVVLLRERRA